MKKFWKKMLILIVALVLTWGPVPAPRVYAAGVPTGDDAVEIVMPDGTVFDPVYYAQWNPDVAATMGTSRFQLYKHYIEYGRAEGRVYHEQTINQYAGEDGLLYRDDIQPNGVTIRTIMDPATGATVQDTINPPALTFLSAVSTHYNTRIGRAKNVQLASSRARVFLQQDDPAAYTGQRLCDGDGLCESSACTGHWRRYLPGIFYDVCSASGCRHSGDGASSALPAGQLYRAGT